MRILTYSLLLALAALLGTTPALRAQEPHRNPLAAAEETAAEEMASEEAADARTTQKTELRPMTINEKRRQRGLTDTHNLFVPRGQWIFGGTASYSAHSNDSYRFLVIEGIESEGYTFRISPMVAYAFRNNMALGARFAYGRTLLKLDKANLSLGDEDSGINLQAKDFYSLKHSYTISAIWRQYIPLGRSKRFALFNETQLSVGGSQARFANDSPVKGTYETGYSLSLIHI